MKADFGHIQINVNQSNLPFYDQLMKFLGWKFIYQDDNMVAYGHPAQYSLWFLTQTVDVKNNYDGTGMNHLGFHVESIEDVDNAVKYLQDLGIPPLFDTPRHRQEFSSGPDDTYYQVMFESPDKILFEIVYLGPKK